MVCASGPLTLMTEMPPSPMGVAIAVIVSDEWPAIAVWLPRGWGANVQKRGGRNNDASGGGENKNPRRWAGLWVHRFELLVFLVQSRNVAKCSKEAAAVLSLWLNFTDRLLVVLFVDIHLLPDREQVEHEVVQIQARWKAVEQQCHHERHHPDHCLLPWILHRHLLLDEGCNTHEHCQAAYLLDSKQRDGEGECCNHVGNGKIVDPPEEVGLTKLDGGPKHIIQGNQNRKLEHEGGASTRGIDPILLVEPHDL